MLSYHNLIYILLYFTQVLNYRIKIIEVKGTETEEIKTNKNSIQQAKEKYLEDIIAAVTNGNEAGKNNNSLTIDVRTDDNRASPSLSFEVIKDCNIDESVDSSHSGTTNDDNKASFFARANSLPKPPRVNSANGDLASVSLVQQTVNGFSDKK